MLTIKQKGDYDKTTDFLKKSSTRKLKKIDVSDECLRGCLALLNATPKDTGKTSESWYYKIEDDDEGKLKIQFCNSNVIDYVPIAVILQYGHATGNGGWVEGIDYINPAIRPIFEQIEEKIWKEVSHGN